MITEQLAQYYAVNAATYDAGYDTEEFQDDLEELHERVEDLLAGHKVLELACGTGYWTETLAGVAESVLATDINPAMLTLAEARELDDEVVEFRLADALALPDDLGSFTACFAGFWWSHVKREQQEAFLKQWAL